MFTNTKSLIIALFVAATIPAGTLAAPAKRLADGVTCETSTGSPDTGSVTDVINQVRGKGGLCLNDNDMGSGCTTLVSHNAAAISMCGTPSATQCTDVAAMANEIQQTCLSNGRAGGQYRRGLYVIEVIHS
ncbi:uncharacterized protein K452DRAFT_354931 [Aplosporella prunicola CBS 121167]|uniref:Ecp2 effector protein domain-containing protein n=1 Tax=Aplosporella prunicola CBS 121167 TaxID=1176127 RepID=A0A6A6BTW9_9PEZI|nr:uncharacterized protein K452DRAFT_354931 [Aplosporella prunicola CBS 121167]KAF2147579.1 hypothetical protein K452DRAFT_354931 [Aplosporella prunicola CBS 121167]